MENRWNIKFTFKNVIDSIITGVVAAGSAEILIRVRAVPEGTTAQREQQHPVQSNPSIESTPITINRRTGTKD